MGIKKCPGCIGQLSDLLTDTFTSEHTATEDDKPLASGVFASILVA